MNDLTVADLRRALADLPADAPVRVESQAPGVSPTIGFIKIDAGGEPTLVLAHLCHPSVRQG